MIPLLIAAAGCLVLAPGAERITAGDLVPRWPALASLPPGTALGYAPAPGAQRVYRLGETGRLAVRFGVAGPAEPVCVERASAPLERGPLLEAMRRTLPDARIEIVEFGRARVPVGTIEFPRAGLQPGGRWHGYVRYGNERRFPIWARVAATVPVIRVVAAEVLRSGRTVQAAQVRLETREGAPARDNGATALDEVVGRILLRPVAAGAVVPRTMLADPPEVARGDGVRVTVSQGAARLELEAVAERDGRRGERITLRNPLSGKQFTARVTGKGRAAIGAPEETK